MCGRFVQRSPPERVAEKFKVSDVPPLVERFNVAPSQAVLAVRESGGGREAAFLKWGLVPAWAKDPAVGSRLINARSETVTEKPSYRQAFRSRRCLLTTGANELLRPVHGRMPVIIAPGDYDLWLDPGARSPEGLLPLLRPYPAEEMTSHAVSALVNDPANDDPRCAEPRA